MMFNVFCLSQKKMRLHHAWKQMGVQEYNVGSGAFAMCNVQTSSKSKSTDKTMKNPSIFQSVEISRLSCHFRATFFFLCPSLKLPSTVVWQAVSCDADHFKSFARTWDADPRGSLVKTHSFANHRILKTLALAAFGETGSQIRVDVSRGTGPTGENLDKKQENLCVESMIHDL